MRVWDVATGTEMVKLEGHSDSVTSVSWSSDGTRIASGSYDKTVRVWDLATGTEMVKLEGHSDLVTSVSWYPERSMACPAMQATVPHAVSVPH